MSCGKRCYEKEDEWRGHENCSTCPDQDSGKGRTMPNATYCAHCRMWHPVDSWPHKPEGSNIKLTGGLTAENEKTNEPSVDTVPVHITWSLVVKVQAVEAVST